QLLQAEPGAARAASEAKRKSFTAPFASHVIMERCQMRSSGKEQPDAISSLVAGHWRHGAAGGVERLGTGYAAKASRRAPITAGRTIRRRKIGRPGSRRLEAARWRHHRHREGCQRSFAATAVLDHAQAGGLQEASRNRGVQAASLGQASAARLLQTKR